jgi:glucose/arabinose dehydrogenase
MKLSIFSLFVHLSVFTLFSVACQGPGQDESDSYPDPENGGIDLPADFSAIIVADALGSGRHIAVRENGDVYLALRQLNNGNGIVALRDEDGDGRCERIEYFWNTLTTGIEIYDGHLYFSNNQDVYRVPLPEEGLIPSDPPAVIASGFPLQNQHNDKTFALDRKGGLYVNVGAPSNACMEKSRTLGSPGLDPCPQLERQAGIWIFDDSTPGQTQLEEGRRYASGIRNSIALEWNRVVDKLYVVQHGRDQLHQLFPDLYNEQDGANLPAEEFFQVDDGDFFGWPYCYFDQLKDKKVLAPEYGGNGEKTGRCEEAEDPIMAFPGHVAPNDLLFYTGKQFPQKYLNGAFVAFHGSWNRAPLEQEGYYVVFIPFEDGLPSGDWEVFADGFAQVETIRSPRDAVYRPMGLAEGPDGSLYVSDSRKGRIWRIFYSGE